MPRFPTPPEVRIRTLGDPLERFPSHASEIHVAKPPRKVQPRVAVLYSGRFFGSRSLSLVRNHLDALIRPYNASVFLVCDTSNWCHVPRDVAQAYLKGESSHSSVERVLQRQVTSLFGKEAKAAFVNLQEGFYEYQTASAHEITRRHDARVAKGDSTKAGYSPAGLMRRWFSQYSHIARANDLRSVYGPHDLIVRMRLDAYFNAALDLHALWARMDNRPELASRLLAQSFYVEQVTSLREMWGGFECRLNETDGQDLLDRNGNVVTHVCTSSCRKLYRDWIFVGTPLVFATFDAMSSSRTLYASDEVRCEGFCQEEQTLLHLRRAGLEVEPLPSDLSLRIERTIPATAECHGGEYQPFLNWTELKRRGEQTYLIDSCDSYACAKSV